MEYKSSPKNQNLRRSLRLMPKPTEGESPLEIKYEEQNVKDTLLNESYQFQEKSSEYEILNKFIKKEENTDDTALDENIKCEEKSTECISRLQLRKRKKQKHVQGQGTPLNGNLQCTRRKTVKSKIVSTAAPNRIASESNFQPEYMDVNTENKTSNPMSENAPTANGNFPELLMEIIIGEKYLNIITPYDYTKCRKSTTVTKTVKRRRRRRRNY